MASQERFGFEWATYNYMLPDYEEQFLNWVTPFTKESFKGKTVLDAGCGMGRNSYWPLLYGAASVVAFDFDDRSVAAARNTLRAFSNAEILFGNIETFSVPQKFDIVFSIGVIHHLKHPDRALRNLVRMLKPGGTLLIWVYGYEGNEWIVRMVNPIRKLVTSKLPLKFVHVLSYGASIPLYLFLKYGSPRSAYLRQIRKFNFKHIHSIVFDQLIPEVAYYWKKDEAVALLASLPELKNAHIERVNSNSWTVHGIKK
mgnify:CR=1 FL=1